jgi:PKD domain
MHMNTLIRFSHPRVMAALCAATMLGGCSIDKQSAPSLAGPSGFGISFTLTASPTVLPRDGNAQTTITVVARDASGQPKPDVALEVAVSPSIPVVALDPQTRSDGSARFLVTAPTTDVVAPEDNNVVVWVLPQGEAIANDFQNKRAQSVRVNLSGPRNATYPAPSFVTSPEAPVAPAVVAFDASATTDEGVSCISCTYSWTSSHGESSGGMFTSFEFLIPGTYAVRLTVIDSTGSSSSIVKSVEIKAEEEDEGDM